MSILKVDTVNEKTSGNGVVIPGHVVQYKYRSPANNEGFSTTSSSMVDVTNYYVDITPKSASNLLVFTAPIWHLPTGNSGGYSRWRVVDSNNSDAVWNLTNFIGSAGYLGTKWENVTLMHTNVAGTTNAMRLQVQVRVTGGGTLDLVWSSNETKTVAVMEIAQ